MHKKYQHVVNGKEKEMSYIICLALPVVVFLVGLWLVRHSEFFAVVLVLTGLGLFVVSLIAWPISRFQASAEIASIEAVRMVCLDRLSFSESERFAIVNKVVDTNKRIAEIKFYSNHTVLRMFWPDEARNLQLISGGVKH